MEITYPLLSHLALVRRARKGNKEEEMSKEGQELVWVDKEFAERLKKLETDKATREQQLKVFDEYITRVNDSIRRDFKSNLESIEEDAAIFTGLMLKTRQAFEKAKQEQLIGTEEIWEKFEKELPSMREKTQKVIDTLRPLKTQLAEINDMMGKIRTIDIERFIEVLSRLSTMHGQQREMFDFLMKNFGKE